MIKNFIPGFNFIDPNLRLLDVRMGSVCVIGETRRLRTIWTPELAQDLSTFHNIEIEDELTALLAENLRNEIDQQIIQDIHDNQRFYEQNNFNNALNRWNQITQNQNNINYFDNINILPVARRVRAQVIGLDLVPIQPLTPPDFNYLDYLYPPNENYTTLPNEEGWFMNGVFESLLIKMEMRPYKFLKRRYRSDIRRLCGL